MTYALQRQPVGFLGAESSGSPAGPINGVALLTRDLRDIAARGHEFMKPDFTFSKSKFKQLLDVARPRDGESESETVERVKERYSTLSGEEVQTLIAGVVGSVAEGVVRATALSQVKVSSEAARADNHRLQASIIDPARLQWSMLSELLTNAEAQQARGTSGLGLVVTTGLVIAVSVGVIMTAAAVISWVYLSDAQRRMEYAAEGAKNICQRNGGCTPEQEAAIRRQLQLGPFDEAARAVGEGISASIIAVSVGGAALVAGAIWYYAFDGREWLQEKLSKRRRTA